MVEAKTRYVIMIKLMLKKKTYVTSAALAEAAGVSVRTAKYDLQEMRGFLKHYGMEIEARRFYGYRLLLRENSDMEGLSKVLRTNLNHNSGEVFRYNFHRVIYIINKLLMGKPYYKVEELTDIFYISRSTLTRELGQARTLLAKFRLEIDMNRRRGVGIRGTEVDKRLCIAEYSFRYDDKMQIMVRQEADEGAADWSTQRDTIIPVVEKVCRQGKIRLSAVPAIDLANHIYVSILRMKKGCFIETLPEASLGEEHRGERLRADEIADELEGIYGLVIPDTERDYLALHILGKKMPERTPLGSGEYTAVKQCVTEILLELKDNFELDFTNDRLLKEFLYTGIEPMVFRLRTHLIVRNPLLFENLRRYLFATKVAHSASGIIEKCFNVQMDNNEFAYMVPVINTVIISHENRKKFKVGFCGDMGLQESFLYYNELAECLPGDRYELLWIDSSHNAGYLSQVKYLIYDGDFRFDTPIPCYEIQDKDSVEAICSAIARHRLEELQIQDYLRPEFGIFGLEGRDRDEVMKNLYIHLLREGLIAGELDWRDVFRINEIGNGVANIQDLGRVLKRGGYYVCVLKTPILWEQDIVKLLVLVKTKRDGDKNLADLCRIVSEWTSSPKKIERFLKSRSYDVFRKDIIDICLRLYVH